jgi:HSP20 family protein
LVHNKKEIIFARKWAIRKREDKMSMYFSYPRMMRRQMMEHLMPEGWKVAAENEVIFPVDVSADQDAYVISAVLPGISSEELDIQIANETVTLSGEMKVERDEKASYLVQERPSGHFTRELTLPTLLDANGAEAHLVDGILTLRVPKAEAARPRTIKINAK